MMALLLPFAAFVAIFMGFAAGDQPATSEIVHLGSGSRPIYRIGYSGDGSVEIDDLIEQAQMSYAEATDDSSSSGTAAKASSSQTSAPVEAPQFDPPSETDMADLSQDASEEENGSDRSQIDAVEVEEEMPPYVRVPVVSDPSGAEVYIDGIFCGVTPFIATVEPESHLVEAYLEGYWNWFNVVDFSLSTGTVPITLTSKETAYFATGEPVAADNVSALEAAEMNGSGGVRPPPYDESDFVEANYRKLLIVVAILSFLIGSGSFAAWARSRLTTSVKISFPRDGEDRWAGLVEGQTSCVRGRKKQVYVLVRYDDDHLQVKTRVEPNRDGRWSTRCDVKEGTIYRIYAVVVDRPLIDGAYLDEIPSHRAISEVGPVTGKGKAPKSADG